MNSVCISPFDDISLLYIRAAMTHPISNNNCRSDRIEISPVRWVHIHRIYVLEGQYVLGRPNQTRHKCSECAAVWSIFKWNQQQFDGVIIDKYFCVCEHPFTKTKSINDVMWLLPHSFDCTYVHAHITRTHMTQLLL